MGANVGLVRDVDLSTINELFQVTQPSHLQKLLNKELSGPARAEARAEYLRGRLSTN